MKLETRIALAIAEKLGWETNGTDPDGLAYVKHPQRGWDSYDPFDDWRDTGPLLEYGGIDIVGFMTNVGPEGTWLLEDSWSEEVWGREEDGRDGLRYAICMTWVRNHKVQLKEFKDD